MTPYTMLENMSALITDIPPDSIVSRTVFKDDSVKVVLFGFAQGQSLSEHSAGQPAIIHILQGEATLTLGGDKAEAQAGTWVHMPTRLLHSVYAKTPLIMLLLMLKGDES